MKVCIAGGGRVGRYLAQSLLTNHHEIVIIEPVESQCRMLADTLDIPVICGDSISVDTLRQPLWLQCPQAEKCTPFPTAADRCSLLLRPCGPCLL